MAELVSGWSLNGRTTCVASNREDVDGRVPVDPACVEASIAADSSAARVELLGESRPLRRRLERVREVLGLVHDEAVTRIP